METEACFHKYPCFSFPQLREFQQKNSPSGPAVVKKKKKLKNDGSPETSTARDDHSPEEVSLGCQAAGVGVPVAVEGHAYWLEFSSEGYYSSVVGYLTSMYEALGLSLSIAK